MVSLLWVAWLAAGSTPLFRALRQTARELGEIECGGTPPLARFLLGQPAQSWLALFIGASLALLLKDRRLERDWRGFWNLVLPLVLTALCAFSASICLAGLLHWRCPL